MKHSESVRHWVDEAIKKLGYLKPESAQKILQLIEQSPAQPASAIATKYRKDGEQIEAEEKKRLGIRANGFMSTSALADLTDKGLAAPLAAHEQTILRATLAHARAVSLAKERSLGVTQWECVTAHEADCPGCARMNGQAFSADEILPTGPQDCFREACAIGYIPIVDYDKLATSHQEQKARPWWKLW